MQRPIIHHCVLALSVFAMGAGASAAPKPMELAAVFTDGIASDLKLPKELKACSVRISALADERRSPEMIGIHSRRAIRAPVDRNVWLRSMVAALKSRKIAVAFSSDEATSPGAIPLDVALTKAWIANTYGNMSANIVFRVRTTDAAGAVVEQSYRGGASHSGYFSDGPGQLQRAFDTSVSRGLDAMAGDIHKLCGNII